MLTGPGAAPPSPAPPAWALYHGDVVAQLHRVPTAWASAVISAPPLLERLPFSRAWLTMVLGQCRVGAREGASLVLLVRARDLARYVVALQDTGWVLEDIVAPPSPRVLGVGRFVVQAVKGRPGRGRLARVGRMRQRGLLRNLVRCCTPEGGRVLDPFAGSGGVALAALAEGRSYLGVAPRDGVPPAALRRLEGGGLPGGVPGELSGHDRFCACAMSERPDSGGEICRYGDFSRPLWAS